MVLVFGPLDSLLPDVITGFIATVKKMGENTVMISFPTSCHSVVKLADWKNSLISLR